MKGITFDHKCFKFNGKESFLVSGEFHYFRVPADDWKRRMLLFKQAGGNCIATYIPWCIHEPEEGNIVFDDVPQRSLTSFLKTAQEVGLSVILRPGPYQYSELDNDGLPGWLVNNYPEILARRADGTIMRASSVSYLHPVFLEKARRYFKAFAELARPFMTENGGPVCMLQVDNEIMGIHIWNGSMDYNAQTMGFGCENGRYPLYLKKTYGTVDTLNAAYGSDYAAFTDVMPIAKADQKDACSCRRFRDYQNFYCETIGEYLALLKSWLREDDLNEPICHNSGNPNMNPLLTETVAAMGDDFLLGSDHYYNLEQTWPQNNPTPQYAIRIFVSLEQLKAMGMPPSVLELPAGSYSDTPPILKEDLLACYMTNTAMGAKGINFYVFTGGPNFGDTGNTCTIYDYGAFVHADGSLNETYSSLLEYGTFTRSHAWMQQSERTASVQLGFTWEMFRSSSYDCADARFGGQQCADFTLYGILYSLFCSRYAPELRLLSGGKLDTGKPLIVPCMSAMDKASQDAVVDFIKQGGKAIILPVLPDTTPDGEAYSPLKEYLHIRNAGTGSPSLDIAGLGQVYRIDRMSAAADADVEVIAADSKTGESIAFKKKIGAGDVIFFGGKWKLTTFPQCEMLETFLAQLGAKPTVISSNRNIFTSLWEDPEGHRTVFLMNLYSGRNTTDITLGDGTELGRFDLAPMEVKVIDL